MIKSTVQNAVLSDQLWLDYSSEIMPVKPFQNAGVTLIWGSTVEVYLVVHVAELSHN